MTAIATYAAQARANGLAVFRWWWREISSLIPRRLKEFFEREDSRLIGNFDGRLLRVPKASGAEPTGKNETEAVDLVDPAGNPDGRLTSLSAGHEIDILLDEDLTIFTEVRFPRLGGKRLEQAIRLRAANLFPLELSHLSLAYRLLPPVVDNETRVEIAAARRSTIDTLLGNLEKTGTIIRLLPDRFFDDQTAHPFALTSSPWRWGSLSLASVLGLATLLMLVLSPIVYWARLEIAIANFEDVNQALRTETAPLIDAIEREREDRLVAHAINSELGRPSAAVILERLSTVLSDEHYLIEYRQGPGEVRLRGIGPDPASLVPLIEHEPFATGTKLISATRNAADDSQDYQIAFDLVVGGRP